MLYNYHTHTVRCGHASGGDKEFVEAAIKAGIKVLGFADHTPQIYPDDIAWGPDHRMPINEFYGYCDSVLKLKEEYKNDIEIHLGGEVEYYPKAFNKTAKFLRDFGIEYFLLGQHYTKNQWDKGAVYTGSTTDDKAVIVEYTDTVIEQMASGEFMYVAHPDLIHFVGDDEFRDEQFRRICEASVKTGVPLEVNLLGIRLKRWYPNKRFWEIAGECGVQAIVGCDAHDPVQLLDAEKTLCEWEPFLNSCGIDVSRETFLDFEKTCKKVK